jgi:hypothetical protein
MFGPEQMRSFREFKAIWDPGQLPDDNAELSAIWCVPGEQIETG